MILFLINNRLAAAIKQTNKLSNTVLSDINKSVLIHFKLCYGMLLIALNAEKTVLNKYGTKTTGFNLVAMQKFVFDTAGKNVFLQFKLLTHRKQYSVILTLLEIS